MLTPLIILWVGEERALSDLVIGCIMFDYYFKGERIVLTNYKTAAGVFQQDKYLPLIQGAVNLVVSIVLVQKVGLVGIYIGTIVSGLIANITRPFIIYKVCFDESVAVYFKDSLKYIAVNGIAVMLLLFLKNSIMTSVTIPMFILMVGVITVVYNALFVAIFGRCREFAYLWGLVVDKMRKKSRR